MTKNNDRLSFMTTFVRPIAEACPDEGFDRIYVTEQGMDAEANPMWDLAGFPHLYRVVAEFSDRGSLIEVAPDCRFIAGLLRDLPRGSHLHADVTVDVLDQLMELTVEGLAQRNAPDSNQRAVVDGQVFQVNTSMVEPISQAHTVTITLPSGQVVFNVAMTHEQALVGQENLPAKLADPVHSRPKG